MTTKLTAALIACGLALALASQAGTIVSVTGDGACGKCQLKETKVCQPTVTVTEDGKKIVYYLKESAATKEVGKQLCSEHKQLKVTGTVENVNGKLELTPTKVEVVKSATADKDQPSP